jgi:hypothetical protein
VLQRYLQCVETIARGNVHNKVILRANAHTPVL